MTLPTIDEKIQNIQSSELALSVYTSEHYSREIQQCLQSYNSNAIDYLKAAKLFFSRRLFAHAACFQLQSLSLAPRDPYLHCFMGTIYMSLGLRESAIQSFKYSMMHYSRLDSRYWNGNDKVLSLVVVAQSVGEVVLAI